MTLVALAVMTLTVVRVVRLVTTDDLTQGWRDRIYRRSSESGNPTLISRWVSCDWCVGLWLAAPAAVLGRVSGLVPTWPWATWAWLGIAGGAGLLSRLA